MIIQGLIPFISPFRRHLVKFMPAKFGYLQSLAIFYRAFLSDYYEFCNFYEFKFKMLIRQSWSFFRFTKLYSKRLSLVLPFSFWDLQQLVHFPKFLFEGKGFPDRFVLMKLLYLQLDFESRFDSIFILLWNPFCGILMI
jgi:hypothetical protein